MSLRRIWLDVSHWQGDSFYLEDETFRHAFQVLRLMPGEKFEILGGGPQSLVVSAIKVEKKRALIQVHERVALPVPKDPPITLVVSMPRAATFEWIIEKSVELGAGEIIPVTSANSFIRDLSELGGKKVSRWQKILQSSTEQCRRGSLMNIAAATTLRKVAESVQLEASKKATLGVFAYEGACETNIKSYLTAFVGLQTQKENMKGPEKIYLFIGSEGGFSNEEVAWMKDLGFPPVSMGPLILRADTACIAALSAVSFFFGAMTS